MVVANALVLTFPAGVRLRSNLKIAMYNIRLTNSRAVPESNLNQGLAAGLLAGA